MRNIYAAALFLGVWGGLFIIGIILSVLTLSGGSPVSGQPLLILIGAIAAIMSLIITSIIVKKRNSQTQLPVGKSSSLKIAATIIAIIAFLVLLGSGISVLKVIWLGS